MLQESSAALCIEKSYAVNRYKFNRYVSLVSCRYAIQDEQSLRATRSADKYFLKKNYFRLNAVHLAKMLLK